MGSGDDELELGGEFTYVQELGRLGELLGTVSSGASGFMRQDMHGAARVAEAAGGEVVEPVEQDAIEAACIEISEIFERYQLQPALLDPHLEGWLAQLFVPIKADDKVRLHHVCRAVYVLAKVRGYKTVVKFFPHEVRDLEPALELLLEDRGRLGVRFHEGDNLAAQDGLVVESVLPSGLVARCAAEAADHGGGEAWRRRAVHV